MWRRIVDFLVKRHELFVSTSSGTLQPHQVEHICPQKPKKGCWQWAREGMLKPADPLYSDLVECVNVQM